METTASFGYWIRRQRKALDLTQQALAERVGCSLAAIKKIESDERRPSRQVAERLADSLGVPANQRGTFVECARGLRPVEQLLLARQPVAPTSFRALHHNLPTQLTSFIGREHELSEIQQLLATTHLLTLTGPGGTGKTRLALQLATAVLPQFPDGVWLVELAPLADPALVPQTAVTTLGVREQPGQAILDTLTSYVRAKTLLLLLDNCEHLIEACAQLADTLLRSAPRLKILASSREALGIAGETAYRVPSLPLPERQAASLEALLHNDCVRLFVDRARAAYPPFRLKDKNAPAIADVCRRLDGIPLAIELAAARTKVFPPEEIALRLDDRFRLLTGGSRTALERHQTLRALIDWSYDLLSAAERALLQRLSVFAGGWTMAAAQAVCGEGLGDAVLNLLMHLVDKSLVTADVQTEAEEARYALLETIRQYARDRLFESGQAEQVRDRHLEYYLRFAEAAEPKLRGAEQLAWLERVETEHDNLRMALAWSLESGESVRALRLAGALYYFWEFRAYFAEGRRWLDEALALSERRSSGKGVAGEPYTPTSDDTARRAKALYAAGRLHFSALFDPAASRRMVEDSLGLWRELGDKWWMAVSLEHIGFTLILEGDEQTARGRLEEGVSLARQVEDRWPLALCLRRLASVIMRIDTAAARRVLEEGLALARSVGDQSLLTQGLNALMTTYFFEGNLTAAARVGEEALAEVRATGDIGYVTLLLFGLVIITCLHGDLGRAEGYGFELRALARAIGPTRASPVVLLALGFLAIFSGQLERGVRLSAAAEAVSNESGIKLSALFGPAITRYEQALARAQAQLAPAAFAAAWAEGQQMTLEQAMAEALSVEKSG